MSSVTSELAPSDSPNLTLTQPTPEEKEATWKVNGQAWQGSMDMPTYIRREIQLENQELTREGGITFWVLVDATLPPNARPILSSCESIRKKAVIARGGSCKIMDITSHGIASVYCDPRYRRRGYAQRMINELGKRLDNWQQKDGERTNFTILFSDIGKTFYSRMGWEAFPSSHIALSPVSSEEKSSGARYLHAEDLPELCRLDERWLRGQLEQRQISDSNILVALIPDAKTIRWHHAREEFAGKELLGRDPSFKGAYAKTEAGEQVWCIWTRTFGSNEAGNTLNILRFVIEGDQVLRSDGERPGSRDASQRGRIRAGAAVLRAAQLEAARWKMNDVQLWNPTPMTILAAQEIEPSSQLIHREEESIASLRWHGMNPQDRENLEWVGNEKYGWC